MNIKGTKNKIICEGNFIFDNAEALKVSLLEKLEKLSTDKPVTVELAQVIEIDSSGLQLLLSFFRTMENRKIQYKIINISDEMVEILNLSGLNKYFRLEV